MNFFYCFHFSDDYADNGVIFTNYYNIWSAGDSPSVFKISISDPCFDGSGGTSCCTSSNPCEAGYGDCDTDDDCIGTLKCGQGNGFDNNCDVSLGFVSTYDCCYEPEGKAKQRFKL